MMSLKELNMTPEEAAEKPMVDLAFAVLKARNEPMYYRDLMQEIARIKGISDDEVMEVIAQLYTEINIDGRFACVGNNLWGLKRWYPVERVDDPLGGAKHPRIINDDDDDDLDDETLFADEADEFVSDDDEDFDRVDEDGDDLFGADDDDLDEEVDEDLDDELDDSDLEDVVDDVPADESDPDFEDPDFEGGDEDK